MHSDLKFKSNNNKIKKLNFKLLIYINKASKYDI